MQNRCQFHIKFYEESKNELYFNLRSYPMTAEVKAEFLHSFLKYDLYFESNCLWHIIQYCLVSKRIDQKATFDGMR